MVGKEEHEVLGQFEVCIGVSEGEAKEKSEGKRGFFREGLWGPKTKQVIWKVNSLRSGPFSRYPKERAENYKTLVINPKPRVLTFRSKLGREDDFRAEQPQLSGDVGSYHTCRKESGPQKPYKINLILCFV